MNFGHSPSPITSGRRPIRWLGYLMIMIVAAACTASSLAGGESGAGDAALPPSKAPATSAPATGSTPSAPSATTPPDTLRPQLAASPIYSPAESDVLRDRKQAGGRFAQAALTYDSEAGIDNHIRQLVERFEIEPSEQLRALLQEALVEHADSVATVRYVQMGGNRATTASLMVWVDIDRLSSAGRRESESRVLDVRVVSSDGNFAIASLESAGGPAVERPDDLPLLAAEVVDHPGIQMPDSARWDIFAQHTTDTMLKRMLEVASQFDYSVLVLSRGHPYNVFATDSVSRHSVGQAMDVYEVSGKLVVDSRSEGSPAWELSRNLYDSGIPSIGSPWAFDGFSGRSFTDEVHQDHLHITGY